MQVTSSAFDSMDGAPRRARPVLVVAASALAFGVLTQALLWPSHFGAGWAAWVLGLGAFALQRFHRGRFSSLSLAWCAALAWLVSSFVLRASDWTAFIVAPFALVLLSCLPFVLSGKSSFDAMGSLPLWVAGALGACPRVAGTAKDATRSLATGRAGTEIRRAAVGLMLGIPLSLCFVGLFSADPHFSAWMQAAGDSTRSTLSFSVRALLTAAIGATWLGAVQHVIARPDSPTFPRIRRMAAGLRRAFGLERAISAGDADRSEGSRLGASYRSLPAPPVPIATDRFRLAPTTWLTVLIQIVAVFALFVAAALPSLFRGHAYLRAAGTGTYAQYLHAGFVQLTVTTALSVVVVLVGQWALAPSREAEASRGTLSWVGRLELLLIGLTVLTLAMCAQRLALYQQAYGATYLRLGVRVFQCWMLLVLGLTAARVWRPALPYAAWLAALSTAVALVAATFNADLYIARTNVARLELRDISTADLDVDYLATLSDDAAPVLRDRHFSAHPDQKRALEAQWREQRAERRFEGWRAFRGVAGALELR